MAGWAVPHWESDLPSAGLDYAAGTAQAALGAIAGAMITLAGFVVTAITLVVQTVQAMSPRLVGALHQLGRYLFVFAALVGTAVYALVVLSGINDDRVPRTAVTLGVALVLVDSVAVLHLLVRLRQAVTGGGLARAVGARLRHVIDQVYPDPLGPDPPGGRAAPGPGPAPGSGAVVRHTGAPGMIQSLDERRMVRLADRAGVRVELTAAVGDFLGGAAPVAHVLAPPGTPVPEGLTRRLAGCVVHGQSRTVEQDPAYGLRLLVDIAVRALSPAVNDPTTAVQALDQIEEALVRLAPRALGPAVLTGPDGQPRVRCPAPHWADLVGLALDEVLFYGAGSLQVPRRLRVLLERVRPAAPPHRHGPLDERGALLDRLTDALPDTAFRRIAGSADRQGLGGPAPAGPAP
ncbi:DUF2254 domain-containing protein [Kitasatospora sp. NPDC059571]|uniref:DUF2254 domain-containing protein n=1 Tax=Kitasatospora sp. NPDC059571 TaxID=3346871 RepID=UPI00368B9655